jgi:hypothetical protein
MLKGGTITISGMHIAELGHASTERGKHATHVSILLRSLLLLGAAVTAVLTPPLVTPSLLIKRSSDS